MKKQPKRYYPPIERATYQYDGGTWGRLKKRLLHKYPINPKFMFWVMTVCFVSLASVALITNANQSYEPKISKATIKINKEKAIQVEKTNLTKQYFKKYLMNKYPLYEKHTDLILNCVFEESEKKNLSPLLVIAIIEVESSFNFSAVSSVGAKGLMQVYEPSWQGEKGKILFDPEVNISCGTTKLASYLKYNNGNLTLALGNYLGAQDATYNGKIMELVGRYYIDLQKIEKNA
jgi:soluble lytic murein transglycosylase-like protein